MTSPSHLCSTVLSQAFFVVPPHEAVDVVCTITSSRVGSSHCHCCRRCRGRYRDRRCRGRGREEDSLRLKKRYPSRIGQF